MFEPNHKKFICLEPEVSLQPPVYPAFSMFPKLSQVLESSSCTTQQHYQPQFKEEHVIYQQQQFSTIKPIEKKPMVYSKPVEVPSFIRPITKSERKMKPQSKKKRSLSISNKSYHRWTLDIGRT